MKNMQGRPFTIIEFIEFSSHEEFLRFGRMPIITRDEVARCNVDELAESLQSGRFFTGTRTNDDKTGNPRE